MVRSEVLSLNENEFVVGTQATGRKALHISIIYLFPYVISICIMIVTLSLFLMIIIKSDLSFLRLGVTLSTPTRSGILAKGAISSTQPGGLHCFQGTS